MAKVTFRTPEEVTRSQWAEKFSSVASGKLYAKEDNETSPFPIHEYLKNKQLGKKVKMVEVNAGTALIEHVVADTLTEYKMTVNGNETSKEEEEITKWFEEIEYDDIEEELCRSLYANGFAPQQMIRTLEEGENGYVAVALNPATWYPDIPTFSYQKVKSGRVISVFFEYEKGEKVWYAFVEDHQPAILKYSLYRLDKPTDLEGKEITLSTLSRFKGLDKQIETGLDYVPIVTGNRQKGSSHILGTSLLYPIWDLLQEVSEIQTQIRQERIKHLRAKMAAPMQSLSRVERERDDGTPHNSKEQATALATQAALYDLNQEIFPIPAGGPLPAFIQRDLQSITIGSELIDSVLTKAAAIVGCPKTVFNIEEAAGNVKVDTEKRKDRRYIKKILQGQRQMEKLRAEAAKTYWKWKYGKDIEVSVTLQDPFNLSKEELVSLAHSMNPTATLLSEEDAIHMVHADKSPEEREMIIQKIQKETEENALDNPEIGI